MNIRGKHYRTIWVKPENKKILVMGGHKEGIVSFGRDLNEAGKIILNY